MNKKLYFPEQHVHFHNILKPKTSRTRKVARSRGLLEQHLNVTRKLLIYREGKPECSVMTLGGSFTRGEWYQISWWDPLGGQPVVPILPLSQLPATHWVSTWIQTHESPCSALLLCIFSHYNLLFRHMRCHPDFKRNLLGAASCWHCWCWC